MARAVRKCKICGKEYEACKTANPTGSFRWREVACSPEHGQQYLQQIEESRKPKVEPKKTPKKTTKEVVEEVGIQPILEKEELDNSENEILY